MKKTALFNISPFALLLICCFSLSSWADTAHQVLDKMSHGMREVNYDGAFVYRHDDTMHSFRIIHSVVNGKEKERLVYLDGEHREIIRHDHSATCIHPGEKLTRLDHGVTLTHVSDQLTDNLMAVDESYSISLAKQSRIAGHKVDVLLVNADDNDRYNYRLMIDTEHGILLGSEVIGLNGEVLETFRFTSVAINQVIEPSKLKSTIAQPTISHPHNGNNTGDRVASAKKVKLHWKAGYIPKGFMSVSPSAKIDAAANYESHSYTDGLATFTLFIEPIQASLAEYKYRKRGATVMYSDSKIVNGQLVLLTVVGEIPLATARHIIESVEAMSP